MRVHDVAVQRSTLGYRLEGPVERPGQPPQPLYIDYSVPTAGALEPAADAFAAALLLPAMQANEPLTIVPSISPRLHFNLPRLRDVFHTWWPEFGRVPIETTPETDRPRRMAGEGATFFSGGVDSFYSLLRHRHAASGVDVPLTALIFMRGLETRLRDTHDVHTSERSVREIAAACGLDCVIGETNIRTVAQGRHLHWEDHYHGSALAAVALGLAGRFAYICIPSAFSYHHLVATAANPLTNELYSTDGVQIVHDGADVSRAMKMARIVDWDRDLVLRHLRVCLRNHGAAFNCGQCRKCVRTAVVLKILGVWEAATSFASRDETGWEDAAARDGAFWIQENLAFAKQMQAPPSLVRMLKRALRRRQRRDRVKAWLSRPSMRHVRTFVERLEQIHSHRTHSISRQPTPASRSGTSPAASALPQR